MDDSAVTYPAPRGGWMHPPVFVGKSSIVHGSSWVQMGCFLLPGSIEVARTTWLVDQRFLMVLAHLAVDTGEVAAKVGPH